MPLNKVPLVCVSLPDSGERRDRMRAVMAARATDLCKAGVEFSFHDAVKGRQLRGDVMALLSRAVSLSPQAQRALGPAEIGCLLSHLLVWSRMTDGDLADYPRVIVVEDDVDFAPDGSMEALALALREARGFSFLGGFPRYNSGKIFGYRDGAVFRMQGPRYLYTRTCAYLLDRAAAGRLLDRALRAPFVADNWEYLLERSDIPYYPVFTHPEDGPSLIESERGTGTHIKASRPTRIFRKFDRVRAQIRCLLSGHRIERLSSIG